MGIPTVCNMCEKPWSNHDPDCPVGKHERAIVAAPQWLLDLRVVASELLTDTPVGKSAKAIASTLLLIAGQATTALGVYEQLDAPVAPPPVITPGQLRVRIAGYLEGAWVPESHACIEHIILIQRAAFTLDTEIGKVAKLRAVVAAYQTQDTAEEEADCMCFHGPCKHSMALNIANDKLAVALKDMP